ncbi:MAG TPA: hypothetical protein VHC43_11165 [Mycobacteriales bacterium]|nr:hypothetical protein [Mycobacteriales bacterium]
MPDDDARLTGVVVPDDISELARDIAAYKREVRRVERARRLHLLLARRGVVPGLVMTAAALLAGVVAVLLAMMGPRTVGQAPAARPLASPAQAPGNLGGLLPRGIVKAQDGTPVDTHNPAMRPEVFALIPARCGCNTLLNALAGQAGSVGVRLAIVVPTAVDDSAGTIIDSLDRGKPSVYFDPQATLATAVAASGVTAVVVDTDGTIYDIERNITDAGRTSLDAALQSMLLADRH